MGALSLRTMIAESIVNTSTPAYNLADQRRFAKLLDMPLLDQIHRGKLLLYGIPSLFPADLPFVERSVQSNVTSALQLNITGKDVLLTEREYVIHVGDAIRGSLWNFDQYLQVYTKFVFPLFWGRPVPKEF